MYSDSVTKRLDLLIGIGTIIVVILIDPRGDFPLSDDWSYAYTVELACRENRIEYLPWMGAGLFFQALYGTALCKMFGFSFTILRLSTIVAAALGLFSFSRWLSLLEIAPVPRAMAVATLALSPMYVNLSFTFMTDVPFTVLVITALHAYTLGLRNNETFFTIKICDPVGNILQLANTHFFAVFFILAQLLKQLLIFF